MAGFYATLIAIALWMRSRVMWFGLLFFVITLLPVSFIPARLGFVLYLPLAGMALVRGGLPGAFQRQSVQAHRGGAATGRVYAALE